MAYENYQLEDFLADTEFKNWVLNPTPASQLFWEKWMDAHPDQRQTILSAREILLTFQFQKAETIPTTEKNELLKEILNQPTINTPYRQRRNFYYGVAASLLLILSVLSYVRYFSPPPPPVEEVIALVVKENPRGQKTRITLPDGSKVWLNSDSRLEYASKFIDKRKILLKGEAFFEVAEDPQKPLEVHSDGIITTALGTSFNISAFEDHDIEVGLVTGKISVESSMEKGGARVIVSPSEKAVYSHKSKKLVVSPYHNLNFLKWTRRVIVFKKAGFAEIEERLERWYDVDITAHNLNRKITFTGEFNNESLERVLERMAFVEKFSFKMQAKRIDIFFE